MKAIFMLVFKIFLCFDAALLVLFLTFLLIGCLICSIRELISELKNEN